MMDFFADLIKEHFDLIFWTVVALVGITLLIAVKLFHELRTQTEETKRALGLLLRFAQHVRALFRGKAPPATLGETISEPVRAVTAEEIRARCSGEAKE